MARGDLGGSSQPGSQWVGESPGLAMGWLNQMHGSKDPLNAAQVTAASANGPLTCRLGISLWFAFHFDQDECLCSSPGPTAFFKCQPASRSSSFLVSFQLWTLPGPLSSGCAKLPWESRGIGRRLPRGSASTSSLEMLPQPKQQNLSLPTNLPFKENKKEIFPLSLGPHLNDNNKRPAFAICWALF